MPNETPYEQEMTSVLEIWNNLMVKESNGYPPSKEEKKVKASLSNLIRSRSFFLQKLFETEGRRLDERDADSSGKRTDQRAEESA